MLGSLCTPARVGGSACGVDRTVEKEKKKKETNPVASAPSAVQRRQHSQSVDEPKRRRRLAHSSVRGGLVKVLAGWLVWRATAAAVGAKSGCRLAVTFSRRTFSGRSRRARETGAPLSLQNS